MNINQEKAAILWKLARKNNWNGCYDRLEFFKKFPNLNLIIKEESNRGWIIVHKKPKYKAISLNTKHKIHSTTII